MALTDDEKRVLKAFVQKDSYDVPNKELREAAELDEHNFLEALRALEKRELVERDFGHTVLLAKGRVYLRKIK